MGLPRPGSTITVDANHPLGQAAPELVGRTVTYRPHIDTFTANGQIVPWVASQSNLDADDWEIV
ncbi:Thoeris anti-defense Tad2 family protein [Nonomuraea zeae]|uniref:Thoeris anti-defense Tad2 family protein n=1 Tax=Nonomuraea zeae TaxID=1642303 RepID=UPI001F0FB21B|nr:MW1434 family type I TA system toxin [Nonomuraea zeae]